MCNQTDAFETEKIEDVKIITIQKLRTKKTEKKHHTKFVTSKKHVPFLSFFILL